MVRPFAVHLLRGNEPIQGPIVRTFWNTFCFAHAVMPFLCLVVLACTVSVPSCSAILLRRYEVEVEYQKTRDDPTMETVKGKFKAINVALMACITKDSEQGMAPSKRCDDGTFHLIMVKKCSRFQYLRYLIRTAGTGAPA